MFNGVNKFETAVKGLVTNKGCPFFQLGSL